MSILGPQSTTFRFSFFVADSILDSDLGVPLRGVAIGNGWIDSRTQYPSFLEYAVKHGLYEENSDGYKKTKEATDECMKRLDGYGSIYPVHDDFCEGILGTVLDAKTSKCVFTS